MNGLSGKRQHSSSLLLPGSKNIHNSRLIPRIGESCTTPDSSGQPRLTMADKEKKVIYDESSIRSLDWREHNRMRQGMYIGKIGDGSSMDDGIYVLLKEVIDNSIDEHVMGHGKTIDIRIDDTKVFVRDYGRGIPLGKVVECVSQINTGGKYDYKAFQKSVGLNGVGTKAVNALSTYFKVQSFRDGKTMVAEFAKGQLVKEHKIQATLEPDGTAITFSRYDTILNKFNLIPVFI
jgi:topoisomerase-4 subunit B